MIKPLPTSIGLAVLFLFGATAQGQDQGQASVNTSIDGEGRGTIIVEAHGTLPEQPLFYTATADANVDVATDGVKQQIRLTVKVIQGEAKSLSFGLNGQGDVTAVEGDRLQSWSVRQVGEKRFLDLQLKDGVTDINPLVTIVHDEVTLPAELNLAHLAPGDSVGFYSTITIRSSQGVDTKVIEASGFAPLESEDHDKRLQSNTGGVVKLSLGRSGTAPPPVDLVDTTLKGQLHTNGQSIGFQLTGSAVVSEDDVTLRVLAGNAAVSEMPSGDGYRLKLSTQGDQSVYELVFAKAGTYPLRIDFVASLAKGQNNERGIDFTVASGAVVPLTIDGLDANLEFQRDQQSVVPKQQDESWLGFLPATGHARLQWKPIREAGEGKLFYTTTGQVEVQVGAGLLRQSHQIDYQILQGQLDSLSIGMLGPGEILDVQGSNVVGWKITGQDDERQLDITLSQPLSGTSQLNIRSQTPLDAFPVRVEGMRLQPIGAIRHSGFVRMSNLGSVRLEPTALSGLTQLAPEQFPGSAIESRQVFVYRFPAADHNFTIAADRIQPEVNVSQLVLYQVAEADRVIRADVELDIREAPIRQWDFDIPADYSVVSVTGASVADYIAATEVVDDRRNLKVMFSQDVIGRQLVMLNLEKSQPAAAASWELPVIEYPEAKTVRGDIGIVGMAGFRITAEATDLLVEKPLSYFPKPTAGLQHAFRIRETGWSATMQIEPLQRSIQSDVFHLYSLSQETVYGSALINYFVTGAPVAEWSIALPANLGNVMVDGKDVRTWRREGDILIVSLHQPVMGPYTLLVTFEEKPDKTKGTFSAGQITPLSVQGERGYIQIVSPMQVEMKTESISDGMLGLDALELPAEFRLLSTAPSLGTWQYTERPFELTLSVNWFQPGTTATQVVEYSEANSRVSQDGELVTDVLYYVKSRGRRTLRIQLPEAPVRLWEVSVGGQVVTARQAENETLIPLPGGTDPNVPIEVRLRLGKPTVSESSPELALPIVFAPVLKTQWNISGDEKRMLVPNGGTVAPPTPITRPAGFDWVARWGIFPLLPIVALTLFGIWASSKTGAKRGVGLLSLLLAIVVSLFTAGVAFGQIGSPSPLNMSLPILSSGEVVRIDLSNTPLWRVDISWLGLFVLVAGIAAIIWSYKHGDEKQALGIRAAGVLGISLGVLAQGGGAPWFFILLGLAIFLLAFVLPAKAFGTDTIRACRQWWEKRKAAKQAKAAEATDSSDGDVGAVTATILLLIASVLGFAENSCAADANGFEIADSMEQSWQVSHEDGRLLATGKIALSGRPGDQFKLVKSPAVLTRFEGEGLRLTKANVPGEGLTYLIIIPAAGNEDDSNRQSTDFVAEFDFQLDAVKPVEGIAVLTGPASIRKIDLTLDQEGWEVTSPTAVRVEAVESDQETTKAKVLLGPGNATVLLKPRARDVTMEETQFFVEASNLYLPSPGVIDGRHRLHVRTSQGQVSELNVAVPAGLTVSEVAGPVGSWQFDADSGQLKIEITPAQSQAFDVSIETQRGLDPLPADAELSPLLVQSASGQVGLVAIAFGQDAQPEKLESQQMSAVNLGDFDSSLLEGRPAVLHRVYRYGVDGGVLTLRVAPVQPEVRVLSKQVISLGDERIVLGVNFVAEITRAGLFQLSFPLPEGLEVESLTGAALHHWAELTEGDQRQIILHLNGKTIGSQTFSLTLSGPAPVDAGDWQIPRFQLNESTRQTGELVVSPTTGIRLRTVTRENISESDPRAMGGNTQGALAFRLLQRDWNLVLGIEKLDPWITGQVLQEVSLREGQTRTTLLANFNVQNASIRSLQVVLPLTNEDEIKTLRAIGDVVSDFVRVSPDSNTWEVRFKRRVVGDVPFQIEFERRGDRADDQEVLMPMEFPQARQLSYYFAIRAGGRLEIESPEFGPGWQRAEWNSVSHTLRGAANHSAPTLAVRSVAPQAPLNIVVRRHSLADALKLRVASGMLTTVLSPRGNQLTAVDLTMEVIQRSSLSVGLPPGGELFNIFVNGESVNSIRVGGNENVWQFYILPGIDDRTANVRFVYSVPSNRLSNLDLGSPLLNVPLENIQWSVIAPRGYELTDDDGNLELVQQAYEEEYNRDSYLSKITGKRNVQAQQAAQLLEQANQLLQAGEQTKARWALNSVANQYALDAASNEDARVQLENLQTQQAIVGLNTRRQRLYLDNKPADTAMEDNQQLREAAAINPILQQDELNFRPQQLSELLQGNSSEDNAILSRIAARLVQHQRTTEPAPQAILISLPEEGRVYTFGRSVQVAENAPLELEVDFALQWRLAIWKVASLLLLLAAVAATFAWVTTRGGSAREGDEPAEPPVDELATE